MKKIQVTARIIACFCLFLALFFIAFSGIPFWNVSPVTKTDKLNVAPDLASAYALTLTPSENVEATYNILSARLSALPYDDVSLLRGDNNTLLLITPRRLGGAITTIAQTICGTGQITYTAIDGHEIIPPEAVESAKVGYGILDSTSATPVYYLEFFLKDEFRQTFREETKKLSEAKTGQNIMSVNMDGSAILQATVSEEMTEESFIMGGRFTDAILPNLYASYVNTPALEETVSYGSTVEVAPSLGKTAYPLMIAGVFVAVPVISCGIFFVLRKLALPVFFTLLLYVFSFFLFFQITLERISALSFLAAFFCMIPLSSAAFFIVLKYRKEMKMGRDLDTAFQNAAKNSALFIYLCYGIWALVSGVLFAVFSSADLFVRDFFLVFFLSSLFALLFGYVFLRLFLCLQKGLQSFSKK